MNWLLTSDWHLTDKTPRNRIDDYFLSQYKKVTFILETARKKDARVLIAGDVFDSARTSNTVLQNYIELFKTFGDVYVYCITGQHDVFFHSQNIDNSPVKVLESAEALTIANNKTLQNIDFVQWGGEIPNKSKSKILVIHKMVVDTKLWHEQTGHEFCYDLLEKTQYDLILTGDNHKQFTDEYKGRFLVNPGSLMRKNSDQIKHKPAVWIYDDKSGSLEKVPIPIEPAKKVFDFDRIETEKEINDQLQVFISGLNEQDVSGLDYIQNVYNYLDHNKIGKDVRNIIEEVFQIS